MLSVPDAALVRNDPGIPDLRIVLDPDALAALVGAVVTPDYVRYKPGTSCLTGFRVEQGTAVRYAHAIAYAPSRAASLNITVRCFPEDRRLRVLERLFDPSRRSRLVRKLLPRVGTFEVESLDTLAYKPERRYVGVLAGEAKRAVLKLYGPGAAAERGVHRGLFSRNGLRVARCIGRSRRHRVLAFEWLGGERFVSVIARDAVAARVAAADVGRALAELHTQLRSADVSYAPQYHDFLAAVARDVAALHPGCADRARRVTGAAARALQDQAADVQPIHGDFYAKQVLVGDEAAAILDLDQAGWGDPALDVANFIAHLEYEAITRALPSAPRNSVAEALVACYEETAGRAISARLPVAVAVNLLRLATWPFRTRAHKWDESIAAVLDRADMLLTEPRRARRHEPARDEIPAAALNRSFVSARVARLTATHESAGLLATAVRVVRHKPGRRALIEYDLRSSDGNVQETVLGKVRAKGVDERTFRLVDALWRHGFDEGSADGISVPQPLAMIADARMWLQRRVPVPSPQRVAHLDDLPPPDRVAEVMTKLHKTRVTPTRRHTTDDELAILRERFALLRVKRPKLEARVDALERGCGALLGSLPPPIPCGIHRDFHPGQLLIHRDRIYVIDLDLFAEGDPALDVGNFLAHVAELSLRTEGDPTRAAAYERALIDRYLSLNPHVCAASVAIYRMVSLARLVQISTTFADRRATTQPLLEYCETLFWSGGSGGSSRSGP